MEQVTLDNPLLKGLEDSRTPTPTTIVIFGITGDLAARKLGPALYNLAHENLLPHPYTIVGVGRRDWDDQKLRNEMHEDVKKYSRTGIDENIWKGFADSLFYAHVNWEDPTHYKKLAERLEELDQQRDTGGNRLFYLAIPPFLYADVASHLGSVGLQKSSGYTRIIVEKPFRKDLESAKDLNHRLRQVYEEDQIYRIDHYLGKETVQNIAVFRFANAIFEPLWNRKYIDNIQITVAESVDVGTRGGYYDESGALATLSRTTPCRC